MKYKSISLLILTYIFSVSCNRGKISKDFTFRSILGTYRLDSERSKLEKYNQFWAYNDLTITFYPDSTFVCNKEAPFIYNDSGKWIAGNFNEWCRLIFNGFDYGNIKRPGSQFTRPFEHKSDTFILFNGLTPKKGQKTVVDLYFKKIQK